MKIMILGIFLAASSISHAQIQYRTKKIKSGKQLYEYRAQRKAGTVFQILGASAIIGTTIGLQSYKKNRDRTINTPQYIWPSAGIFTIGCALKFDAKRKLKRR